MSLDREISSTEKLLDVIRGKDPAVAEDASPRIPPPAGKTLRDRLVPSAKGSLIIGVELGRDVFRFVKAGRTSMKQFAVLECRSFPHKTAAMDDPGFLRELKSSLKTFCGDPGNFSLWALLAAPEMEIALLRIPKVAKKQVDQAVLFTARKTMAFDEKQYLFDYDSRGEVVDSGITKLSFLAYTASKKDVSAIAGLFEKAGYPLDGVTVPPFALENLFRGRWVVPEEKNVAVLTIGEEGSRIEILSGEAVEMTRGIRAGLDSMVEELMDRVNERRGGDTRLSLEDGRSLVMDHFSGRGGPEGPAARFNLTGDAVAEMVGPAMERLVRQVERTLEHYTTVLGNERIGRVYLSGTFEIPSQMLDAVGRQLGIDYRVLDPLEPGNPMAGNIAGINQASRVLYAAALGTALSEPLKSLNLLFPYERKKVKQAESKANRTILAIAGAAVGACIIILGAFGYIGWQKKEALAGLERQLLGNVQLSAEAITPVAAKVREDRVRMHRYGEKYLDMAAINEISLVTPSNIRLLQMNLDMGGPQEEPKAPRPAAVKSNPPGGVVLEGIVTGDPTVLESVLTTYVLKLQESPLFSSTEVIKSIQETFDKQQVLRFVLNVKFAGGGEQ